MTDNEPSKIDLALEAAVRFADAFDRLVTVLEDLAYAVDLPQAPEEDEGDK